MKELIPLVLKMRSHKLSEQLKTLSFASATIIILLSTLFFALNGIHSGWYLLFWLVSVCLVFFYQYAFLKRMSIAPTQRIIKHIESLLQYPTEDTIKETNEWTHIRHLTDRLADHAIESQAYVDGLSDLSRQLKVDIDKLSSDSESLEQSLNEATDYASMLWTVGEEMNQDALGIVETSKSSSMLSKRGIEYVELSKLSMMEIQNTGQSILTSNDKLTNYVNEVNEIISMVSDIASQSKILATNASIQAAKAGKAGRGFNVVAKEVKTLSVTSKQATRRAAEIIKNIRFAISEMQSHVSNGTVQTRRGTDVLKETGVIISRLGKIISEVSEVAEIISLSANEQTIGLKNMNQTISLLHKQALHQKNALYSHKGDRTFEELNEASLNLLQRSVQYTTQSDKNDSQQMKGGPGGKNN